MRHDTVMSTTVKDRIIKVHKQHLRQSFDKWRMFKGAKEMQMQEIVIMEEQTTNQ